MNNSGEEARERAAIDAGEMRDKVAAADPAVAPLGTDAEAAGMATPPWTARAAAEWRVVRDAVPKRDAASGECAPDTPRSPLRGIALALGALLATAAALIVLTLP
jgi:hypothetical protein